MKTHQEKSQGLKPNAVEILLVEDNPGDASLLRETLRRSRFETRLSVVHDGDQALKYLRRQKPYHGSPRPDFILLDLHLPRENGHEVAAAIKSSRRLSGIPILILTSSARDEDKWRAYQAGAGAYLLKPIHLRQYDFLLNYLEEKWFGELRLAATGGGDRL